MSTVGLYQPLIARHELVASREDLVPTPAGHRVTRVAMVLQQQVGPTHDRRERCAQLVRESREKFIFDAVGRFSFQARFFFALQSLASLGCVVGHPAHDRFLHAFSAERVVIFPQTRFAGGGLNFHHTAG